MTLDAALAKRGIEMIAPHRSNRTTPKTQDGRSLRRYKRRWKVERLNSWLLSHRRVAVRYEYIRLKTTSALCIWHALGFCSDTISEMSSSLHYMHDMATESIDTTANGRAPTRRGTLVESWALEPGSHCSPASRTAVTKWKKQLTESGLRGLKARRPPRKLSANQCQRLVSMLKQGARGFATDRWTQRRIQQVIAREFGVTYHPKYVGRLMKALDWSVQATRS